MHPIIKPYKSTEYEVDQSKYDSVSKLPTRSLIIGPSGTGKSVLLHNLILNVYRGCFSRVYIFSASIHLDMSWKPVIKYLKDHLHQDEKKEQYLFDSYDPVALQKIIDSQFKLAKFMKENNMKKVFQIAIILDDMGENKQFMRSERLLETLYVRGRHFMCSTFTSVQSYKMLSPVLRKNATALYIFRLRNQADLDGILDELSALYDRKTLFNIYKMATEDSHSFLFVDLMQTKSENMFYLNLEKKIIPKNEEEF